jgi:hypothetical protein
VFAAVGALSVGSAGGSTATPPDSTVPAPADLANVVATPTSAMPGDDLQVTGTGCPPAYEVLVATAGRDVLSVPDSKGAFDVILVVPDVPPGAYDVVVECRIDGDPLDEASIRLEILAPAGPVPVSTSAPALPPSPSTTLARLEPPVTRPSPPRRTTSPPTPTTTTTTTTVTPAPGTSVESTAVADAEEDPSSPGFEPARSRFVTALPDVTELVVVDKALVRLVALIVLLLIAIGFPAHLFNSTFEQHHDEIVGWFGRGRWLRYRPSVLAGVPGFVLIEAAFIAVTDPDAGADLKTLALFVGLILAVAVVLVAAEWPSRLVRPSTRTNSAFRVYPGALVVAVLLATICTLVDVQPAYVYGLVAGFSVASTTSSWATEAWAASINGCAVLAVAVTAWLLWTPLNQRGDQAPVGFGLMVADAMLAGTTVAALTTLVFGFLPLRFLDGHSLMRWRWTWWAWLYGAALLLFVVILVDRHTRDDVVTTATSRSQWTTMIILFIAFATASLAFWGYFALRDHGSRHGPSVIDGGDPPMDESRN